MLREQIHQAFDSAFDLRSQHLAGKTTVHDERFKSAKENFLGVCSSLGKIVCITGVVMMGGVLTMAAPSFLLAVSAVSATLFGAFFSLARQIKDPDVIRVFDRISSAFAATSLGVRCAVANSFDARRQQRAFVRGQEEALIKIASPRLRQATKAEAVENITFLNKVVRNPDVAPLLRRHAKELRTEFKKVYKLKRSKDLRYLMRLNPTSGM